MDSEERIVKYEQQRKSREIFERQMRIDKIHDNGGISPRFKARTLENYEIYDQRQRQAVTDCRWFVSERPQDCPGLLLLGGTGTGKNHLCAGIMNALVEVQATTYLMTEPVKMLRAVKESWKREGQYESEVVRSFRDPGVLIIDEIGVQFGSDTERMYLTEIINDRYAWLRPTIISGNVTLQELRGIIGDRAVERFREGGRLILCEWESYRGRKA